MLVVTTVVLARLLQPADFGVVAMAAVFIRLIDLIRDLGTGAAVVQVSEADDRLLSSVFWLNLAFGGAVAGVLSLASPAAAILFREPRLTPVLRVLAVAPVLAAASVVPTGLLTRELRFRDLAGVELIGAAIGGGVAVLLALAGYGLWSLVWQTIATAFLVSAGTCLVSRWRPRLVFDLTSLRAVLRFSANLTGFNLVNYLVRYADNFLVGRYLGARDLGLYDLAYRVMLTPLQYVASAVGRALFPIYTRMKADPARLKDAYTKVASGTALIGFPMLFGVTSVAHPLVEVIFGRTWAPVASLLLIFGPLGALQAISMGLPNIYQAMGRTDRLFHWGAVSTVLIVASFVVGLRWGILGVAGAYATMSLALVYPQFRIPLSLIGLPVASVANAVVRPLFGSILMLVSVLALETFARGRTNAPVELGILVSLGAAVYAFATWLWNREVAAEVFHLARRA